MPEVQGAQVVSRIARVMRAVSENAATGITTTDAARHTGLTRPTTHRLLASLAAEGFLDRDNATAKWYLGPELYLLGSLAAERYDITDIARDSVDVLARETGESAFLSARRGYETICLLREEGSFPVRSFVLYEGVRFPLGVASAGIAILAFLREQEIDQYLARESLAERWGERHSPEGVRQRIAETRALGYAVNPGLIVEGSWGMGAAVFSVAGRPEWALSITGVQSRFSADRQPELGRLLLKAAHGLSQRLAHPR